MKALDLFKSYFVKLQDWRVNFKPLLSFEDFASFVTFMLYPYFPFQAFPFQASPFQASPFRASPFRAFPYFRMDLEEECFAILDFIKYFTDFAKKGKCFVFLSQFRAYYGPYEM